jgi:hypothetical protein
MTTNKTNTTMFTCEATSKHTFQTKRFFSVFPGHANQAAKQWLAAQDAQAKKAA